MRRRKLTDFGIAALKAAPLGKRYLIYDTVVPGLAVQVTDRGAKSYVLYVRYPGTGKPARRLIGKVADLPLAKARQKAGRWRELIAEGVDPAEHEAAEARAEARRRSNTFASVAEAFIKERIAGQRTAEATEREIRKWLTPRWGHLPITAITKADVVDLCREFRRKQIGPHAHNVFGHGRRIFKWAMGSQICELERSPFENLSPAILIGKKKPRKRVLNDAEIAACWRACEVLGYPYGPLIRLLLLTGARRDEVGEAGWPEFNLSKGVWTIPPNRFKPDREHVVPLSADSITVLQSLPRFAGGHFLFTTTSGRCPVNGYSKAKLRLDAAMGAIVGQAIEPFVFHDMRRTVRSRLSELRITTVVAELVIGHALPNLLGIYDKWEHLDERREALKCWAARLREIVQ